MSNEKIYEDVERIVNEPNRQRAIEEFHERRVAKRQRKKLMDCIVYGSISLASGLFGCFGWAAPGIAFPIFAVCGLYASFCFGRWFEHGKVFGWK